MKILGVTVAFGGIYAVLAERTAHAIEVVSYHERRGADATIPDAEFVTLLQDLIDETQARDVAMAVGAADAVVRGLPKQEHLSGRERTSAGKLLVENLGFGPQTKVRLVAHGDDGWFVAAARHDHVSSLVALVDRAGGRLSWLDQEGYAWADAMPPDAQALVVVDRGNTKLVVPGRATVESGVYPALEYPAQGFDMPTERRIADAIVKAIIDAATARYADVDRVAVFDEDGAYLEALRAAAPRVMDVEPFVAEGEGEAGEVVDRRPWALARALAIRALQPRHARIAVNFTERPSASHDLLTRFGALARTADAAAIAAGLLVALGISGWHVATVQQLTTRAVAYEQELKGKQQEAAVIQDELGRIATARSVLERVETAQRSGPLAARNVAAIVERIGAPLSASGLVATNGVWTLTGHAPDDTRVAQLLDALRATGYDSSLNSASAQGSRLAYAIELDERPPAPAPVVQR